MGLLPTGRATEAVRRSSVRLVEPSIGLARAAVVLVATVPLPRSGHAAFLVVVPIQAVLTTGGASRLRVGRVPTTKSGQAAPTWLQTLGTPTDVGVVVRPVGVATVAGLQGLEGARTPLALEAPIGAMGATAKVPATPTSPSPSAPTPLAPRPAPVASTLVETTPQAPLH